MRHNAGDKNWSVPATLGMAFHLRSSCCKEPVGKWCAKSSPDYARRLKRREGPHPAMELGESFDHLKLTCVDRYARQHPCS